MAAKNPKAKTWQLEKGAPGTDPSPKLFVDAISAKGSVLTDLAHWLTHAMTFSPSYVERLADEIAIVSHMDAKQHFEIEVLVDPHSNFHYRARITKVKVPVQLSLVP